MPIDFAFLFIKGKDNDNGHFTTNHLLLLIKPYSSFLIFKKIT